MIGKLWGLTVTVILGISCTAAGTGGSESPVPKVKCVVLTSEALAQETEGTGTLGFLRKVEISAPAAGTVLTRAGVEGDPVRKGQVLMVLKDPQLEIRRAQAAAALSAAQSDQDLARALVWEGRLQTLARWGGLEKARIELEQKRLETNEASRILDLKNRIFEAGGTTLEVLNGLKLNLATQEAALGALEKDWDVRWLGFRDEDLVSEGFEVPGDPEKKLELLVDLNTQTVRAGFRVATAKVEAAKAELEAVEELLDAMNVRSPLDGLVAGWDVEEGEAVSSGARLVTVIDASTVVALVPVQAGPSGRIAAGAEVEVLVDQFPTEPVRTKVSWVSPLVDGQTGAVTVKIPVPNSLGRFKPGMFVRATIRMGPPVPTLVVPQTAVVRKTGGGAQVLLVVNRRVVPRDIGLGRVLGSRYFVTSGLAVGDIVIDKPSPLLREGEIVDAR